jgi:predicted acyl esterase
LHKSFAIKEQATFDAYCSDYLFTSVYVPKDVFSDGSKYPIMMPRTGYSVDPYGIDQYPNEPGPSELFAREKFIFVYQDVRGRYMREGDFVTIRPQKPVKNGPRDTDESTDTYDTIDGLVKHVPGNTGKVGVWGISQPGFYATATMIGAHPALVAVSPQAPVTDYYLETMFTTTASSCWRTASGFI